MKLLHTDDWHLGRMLYGKSLLEDQEYFIDDNMTVGEYIASCTTAKVVEFVRFERGEGMEKREDNFAEEVASMIK